MQFVLVSCLFVAPLLAQLDSSDQPPSPPKHVLTGTVVNSVTGAPIPYALVQAEQNAKLTDQNGNFRFDNLISTSSSIQAHKPGYFEPQELGQVRTNIITLSDRPTDVTIPLVPEAVISGHVTNPEGEPLGNLPVRLRFGQIVNGRRIWQQQGHRQTDEDGDFRIANLKPGAYYVEVGPNFRARAVGQQTRSGEKFEVIPAEFYPGVREMSSATPVQLTAGQHVTLDFGMKPVPAYRISGVITGATNMGGLALLDRDGENTNIGVRFDGNAGRFSAFPVPVGSYRLHYGGRDADGHEIFADVPINVTEDIPELRIPAEPTVSIPVVFETEFSSKPSGPASGIVGFSPNGAPTLTNYGQVHLLSRNASNRQVFANRHNVGNGDGSMVLMGVEPGTYDVEIDTNGSYYVASATYAGTDVLSQPLVVAEGADAGPLTIVLRDDGASVTGNVQAPDNNKSALVLMLPEGQSSSPPRQVYVDSSGSFRAQEIPPGTYDILAFDRLDGLEYRNQEVLSPYVSRGAQVTLTAGEQARVTVDLIQTKQ